MPSAAASRWMPLSQLGEAAKLLFFFVGAVGVRNVGYGLKNIGM